MDRPPGVPAAFDVRMVDATEARRLAEQDPAARAGRFRVDVARWAVSAGHIAFPEHQGPVGRRVAYGTSEGAGSATPSSTLPTTAATSTPG